MRAVDEANLILDHAGQVNVFLVAGLLTPGGFVGTDGRLDLGAVRTAVARRLADIPTLRQVPARVGRRQEWRDVEPDLTLHVRALPAVEHLEDLERRCGDLMAEPLSRARPLWELLVAAGPDGGGALILRIHHAIADGVAAADLIRRLLEDSSHLASASDAPLGAVGSDLAPAPSARTRPRRLILSARRIAATLVARGLPDSVLLGERSDRHGVIFLDADLGAVAERAHRASATVNDVVLAVGAAGYRAALAASGCSVPSHLPVSVPVALPRRAGFRNEVGVMLVRLPLTASSPDVALRGIAGQTREQKDQARRQGTLELMRGPAGARLMDRLAQRQHLVAGFVTNVPGPEHRIELAGASLTRIWPVAVLAANVRLGMAATSYAGRLCCGIHFDAEHIDGSAVADAVRDRLKTFSA
ncbi:wax ester/triacylglycerol synthase domain-containing protein [Microbacterium sp. BK668]|uniref:wax ester/triacylglycerol synthase domain-containing protein n=1 Tax=Microbacterium sp. BK668 TaxID=2512118 RepID=UPI001FB7F0A9|nr:wax ester/triacylglycerol synthase domain-containing protein [Microbacterium sp. BK668]